MTAGFRGCSGKQVPSGGYEVGWWWLDPRGAGANLFPHTLGNIDCNSNGTACVLKNKCYTRSTEGYGKIP